ncbi:NAD(P)H-hydrate dehydratase [Maricaulis parjimensis]|uniref:NAD(P)H-hydrate dehydratase n=1 Tax=Maricaulis parjimensis TaxID=144023 RepID=UPI001939DD0E|nr:NAD(P)H-hydrate dehydratase [Maricaulis parjimensis]
MHEAVLKTKDCVRCDLYAVENGVSSQSLMTKAGTAIADAIRARWAPRDIRVLCGPGNNGGDGFFLAENLRKTGWPVRVALLGERSRLQGDAAWAAGLWSGKIESAEPGFLEGADLIVDALFGAGLSRPLDGAAADLVQAMAAAACPRIAVDLPSGMSGDAMGEGGFAPADLTVTFHQWKPAHLLEPFATGCGEPVLADIGIPAGWADSVVPMARLNHPDLWWSALPVAGPGDHKHAKGRLVVFSGGASATGASRLAARTGLRAGAGLVTLATPPAALLVQAATNDAVMVKRWNEAGDAGDLLDALRANAAVIGPALGLDGHAVATVLSSTTAGCARVLDADALTDFQDAPDRLFKALTPADVLTPHEGEFRRLFPDLGPETGNKIERVAAAADRAGCTILLKGADTVIAAPGHLPVINRHADPALATAGSGDVLAGLIGGLLAQGVDPFHAACAAAWLHGDAGKRLGTGLIAEDLPDALPRVLQALQRDQRRRAARSHLLAHRS